MKSNDISNSWKYYNFIFINKLPSYKHLSEGAVCVKKVTYFSDSKKEFNSICHGKPTLEIIDTIWLKYNNIFK